MLGSGIELLLGSVLVPLAEAALSAIPAVVTAIATFTVSVPTIATRAAMITTRTTLATVAVAVGTWTAVRLDIAFRLGLECPH